MFKRFGFFRLYKFLMDSERYPISVSARIVIKPLFYLWTVMLLITLLPWLMFYDGWCILLFTCVILYEYTNILKRYGYSKKLVLSISTVYLGLLLVVFRPWYEKLLLSIS